MMAATSDRPITPSDEAPKPMTPRQRWLALLEGKSADCIPCDYQATEEVTARLLRELDCPDEEALYRKLGIDARRFIEPRWKLPHHPADPEADMWGVRYQMVSYGTGQYREAVWHPLADVDSPTDLKRFRWPEPDDFDYSAVTEAVEQLDDYRPIHAGHFEPFMIYCFMRGMEKAFEDLALRPKLADAILGHLSDFYYEHHRRIFQAGRGRIDLTWVAEDLGGQSGPLISLATYRRFFLPHQVRLADLARSFGVHVMYHSDGSIWPFLPDLIDRVGIEILNPIQWRAAGMDRRRLVEEFGRSVVFHGSIDNQQTLAFGTPEDVRREVAESVEIYQKARWICAPCHNIQPITSTENILALYEAIHEFGGRR